MGTTSFKHCTIVPDELYVRRDADRQIKNILEEMERPGYVLVARQMGKTNLLLHTKKVYENEKEVYTYIDFQGINAATAEELYQAVVNKVIRTNIGVFREAGEEIMALRRSGNPFMQGFTEELLVLLRRVDKLVLILDEIDALTQHSYSDRVFSQIRSHYFERTSYPELWKLTYILSGVMEPKNIIKDPSISPFNIGQKIYMNDFTQDEYMSFADKIGFRGRYTDEVIERIYHWTQGHPRMTWDLCLAIDEVRTVECEFDVDLVVKDRYLTFFDAAPVDTIRSMVAENPKLRDATISLTFGKWNEIENDIKNELYLAGITNYDNSQVKIKNPILEKALPYEWLVSLDRNEEEYVNRLENVIVVEGNYGVAITQLQSIIKNLQDTKLKAHATYLLGLAYFRHMQSQKSLEQLAMIKETDEDYNEAQLIIGHNHSALGDSSSAVKVYRQALQTVKDPHYQIRYKLGIADAVINSEKMAGEADSIRKMLQQIIDNVGEYDDELHAVITVEYYLAEFEAHDGRYEEACALLNMARIIATGNELPYLLYKLMLYTQQEDKAVEWRNKLIKSLAELKEKPETEDFESPMALNYLWSIEILSYFMVYLPDELSRLSNCINLMFTSMEDAYVRTMSVIARIDAGRAHEIAKQVIQLAGTDGWHFSKDKLVDAYIVLYNEAKADEKKALGLKIADLIADSGTSRASYCHFRAYFMEHAKRAIVAGRLSAAERYIRSFAKVFQKADRATLDGLDLVSKAYLAVVKQRQGQENEFYRYAVEYIRELNRYDVQETYNKPEVEYRELVSLKETLLNAGNEITSMKLRLGLLRHDFNHIDRNCRLVVMNKITGMNEVGKFKSFEEMIKCGFCEIVEVWG